MIIMPEVEKCGDEAAVPANKLSSWDALDAHISKLQEKYDKEQRRGNGGGHMDRIYMTATVEDTNSLAAADMAEQA